MYERKILKLTNLFLNTKNPRYEITNNESEAIENILSDQKEKLLNLAKDIIVNGLNPSDLTIVTKIGENRYKVLEGNRRVCTLKILLNSDIISDKYKNLKSKFTKLGSTHSFKKFDTIECVVFEDEQEASKWIKLKHTGENLGVGTVGWDAQQVARFDAEIKGKKSLALQAIDFLKIEDSVPTKIKEDLDKMPTSNLDRLITDKNIQDIIGLEIDNGTLKTKFPKNEVAKGLVKIADDLLKKRIKVKDIYTKKDREKYIESFEPNEIPSKEKEAKPYELSANNQTKEKSRKFVKSKPVSTNRIYLIPRDCIIKIGDKRVNAIYNELKKINCDEFPNAVSILLRVFIELSLDSYINKFNLDNGNIDKKLTTKVQNITDDLENKNVMNKHELKGIRTSTTNKNQIVSIDTFNAYVHNRHLNPISKDLKITWDNIQLFIIKLWSVIQ